MAAHPKEKAPVSSSIIGKRFNELKIFAAKNQKTSKQAAALLARKRKPRLKDAIKKV